MNFKKVLAATLVMLIVMVCAQSGVASEEWNRYAIDEIGMSVSFPAGYDVFTRNMPDGSQLLAEYGITSEAVNEILIENNFYLDAYSADNTKEIAVTMIGSSVSDFSIWSDDSLMFMASSWVAEFEKIGTIVEKYDIHHCGPATFVRLWERATADPNLYGLQYYTTYDYQAINITMHSYNGPITAADEALMLAIVNSAVFGETSHAVVYDMQTDAADFQYEILPDGTAKITAYTGVQSSISIPDSLDGHVVSCIGQLERNSAVVTVLLPASVNAMEGNPFKNLWGLKAIDVAHGNASYVADEGVLYTADREKLVCYPGKRNDKTFVLSSGTKIIGGRAFCENNDLVFLELSEGVEIIEKDAFFGLGGITDIHLPKTVKQIDGNPFVYCSGLMSISADPLNPNFYAQDGVLFSRMEKKLQAFPRNKAVDHYVIPNGIRAIGAEAFQSCEAIGRISFPDSLQQIGAWAFYHCSDTVFALWPDKLTRIDEFAFHSCNAIESVTIPAGVVIGKNAFGSCNGLVNVHIEDGVTEISDYMFADCEMLKHVELPSTLTSIGDHAFRSCESLELLNLPLTVEHIGELAFEKCTNLVIQVEAGSYAEQYCRSNGVAMEYADGTSWKTNRVSYTDPEGRISFLLPEGWIWEELGQDDLYLDAKFVPEKADGRSLVYSCEDIWMFMEESQRLLLQQNGWNRENMNNSMYSPALIADSYGLDPQDVYITNVGKQSYFAADFTLQQEWMEFTIPMKCKMFLCIRNGYMYNFLLSGVKDSEMDEALCEELLRSVIWE